MQVTTDIDLKPVARIVAKFPAIARQGVRLPLLT